MSLISDYFGHLLMKLDRNREGLNDWIYEKAQGQKAS